MPMNQKPSQIITSLLQLSLIFAIIYSTFRMNWETLMITVATLILTLVPSAIERFYHVRFPHAIVLSIVIFIYATLFLGEIFDFYEHFWWWDGFLHFGSALGMSLVAFLVLFFLYQSSVVRSPAIVASLFAFSFGIAMAAVWEIFEFGMDQIFGLNMQKSGLVDTMWDLILSVVGAGLVAIWAYVYLRFGKRNIVANTISEFRTLNSEPTKSKSRDKQKPMADKTH